MKTLLKLEDAGKFFLAYFATLYLGYSWWLFFALLLLPDLSMIGYIFNNKAGAYIYNFFHHQGIGILVFIVGVILMNNALQLGGIILFGHSAMDRIFGYGLKHIDHFKNTHLGVIGNKQ